MDRLCTNCKFFMLEDHGYSNLTTTETICSCIKNKNPYLPAEESYTWRWGSSMPKEILVAETCDGFKEGDGLHFDVEGDVTIDDYANDPELVDTYNDYNNGLYGPIKEVK